MTPATIDEHAARFLAATSEFNRGVEGLGLGDVSGYYWYHTIDLPHGLATPGLYDIREAVTAFPFPADMSGMHVLDVGSATGFFAFEFEKRGAQVVSVELDSLNSLDRFPGQSIDQILAQIERMIVGDSMIEGFTRKYSADQLYFYLLEGPFSFCAKLLGSCVRRCYSTICDLTPAKTGRDRFDLVFLGDVLLHTINPLEALSAVAPMGETLVLTQNIPGSPADQPAMLWVGGDDPARDEVSWWWPNRACFDQLLKKFGFREVVEAGRNRGTMRPTGYEYDRPVLLATR